MMPAVAAEAAARDDLFRRLVLRVVLPFALLTFVNAIDRTNVSFAAARMSADIGLTPTTFGFGVSAFFVAYLLFQFPHASLLRRFGIRPWVVGCLVLWGLSGLLMSQVTSVRGFVVARFLLGMAEAGFAPGATWYISRWTPPEARARALSIALAAVPASLVVGGPLYGWLLGMDNPLGMPEWRWMFLVSAIPNFVLAVFAGFWFVDRPSQALWLRPAERVRLEASDAATDALPVTAWRDVLSDLRVWRCALAWLLVMTGAYALVFWLPQVVRRLDLGGGEAMTGTLSALPQAALVAGLLLNAWRSDRTGERLWHTAAGAALGAAGLLVAVLLPDGPAVLAFLALAGFGIGAAQGVFWTIPASLGIGGGQVPIATLSLIGMFGTAGGIVGPTLLGALLERTGSFVAGIGTLALLLFAASLVLLPWGGRFREGQARAV